MSKKMVFEATEFTCVYKDITIVTRMQEEGIWDTVATMDGCQPMVVALDSANSTVAIQSAKEFILRFEYLVEKFTAMPREWFSEGQVK